MGSEANSKDSQLTSLSIGMAVFIFVMLLVWVNPGASDSDIMYGTVEGCDSPGVRGRPVDRATVRLESGEDIRVFVEAWRCTSGERIAVRKQRGRLLFNTTYVPVGA